MSQYLITEIQDSTGYIHKHISKVKDNEQLIVVNAENKQDALDKYNYYNKKEE